MYETQLSTRLGIAPAGCDMGAIAKRSHPNLKARPNPYPNHIPNPNSKLKSLFQTFWWGTFAIAPQCVNNLPSVVTR